MQKYYTRACNFYYGKISREKLKSKNSLPLHGNKDVSFDHLEIISRKSKKIIHFRHINSLKKKIKLKVKIDLSKIIKKKHFLKLNFSKTPIIMAVLNLTPDSFSDGGKHNTKNKALVQSKKLINNGCDIIDIGGESTRPGSKTVNEKKEWKRIHAILVELNKLKKVISIDTRKSSVMEKGIKVGASIINDVSGLNYDLKSVNIIKKYKIPFVIHHMQGTPNTMQINPKYKNVLLDTYDFFEKKISYLRNKGIKHNNILLDPGIGFGKNLKHNITLISKISIFHSLGFPILLGISRKKFIKDISGVNDSRDRLGGTISATLFSLMQGVQVIRIHDVNEIKQSIKVFKSLIDG